MEVVRCVNWYCDVETCFDASSPACLERAVRHGCRGHSSAHRAGDGSGHDGGFLGWAVATSRGQPLDLYIIRADRPPPDRPPPDRGSRRWEFCSTLCLRARAASTTGARRVDLQCAWLLLLLLCRSTRALRRRQLKTPSHLRVGPSPPRPRCWASWACSPAVHCAWASTLFIILMTQIEKHSNNGISNNTFQVHSCLQALLKK